MHTALSPARRSLLAAVLAALLLAFAAAALAAQPAGAQGSGAIAGTITSASPELKDPAGIEVSLHTLRNREYQGATKTTTDAQGNFRFEGLPIGDEYTYLVTTESGEMTFDSGPVRLTQAQPEQRVAITVYQTTPTDPGLRVGRAVMIISSIDQDQRLIGVSELVDLQNPTNLAFAPTPGNLSGPQGIVRFGLPPNARDLQPSLGLDPAQVIQIDTGFASLMPVLPGQREIGYVYRVPYQSDTLAFEKSLPYGAGIFEILTPANDITINSPDVTRANVVDLGGKQYQIWRAENLASGTRLPIEIHGLPVPFLRRVLDLATAPPVVPGLLALALVAGSIWALRARRSPAPALAGVPVNAQALVKEIADLDSAYAAGSISQADYEAERAERKAVLRALVEAGAPLPEEKPAIVSGERTTVPGAGPAGD